MESLENSLKRGLFGLRPLALLVLRNVLPPNGSRLSCGRLARRRKIVGRSPCPARGTTLRFL